MNPKISKELSSYAFSFTSPYSRLSKPQQEAKLAQALFKVGNDSERFNPIMSIGKVMKALTQNTLDPQHLNQISTFLKLLAPQIGQVQTAISDPNCLANSGIVAEFKGKNGKPLLYLTVTDGQLYVKYWKHTGQLKQKILANCSADLKALTHQINQVKQIYANIVTEMAEYSKAREANLQSARLRQGPLITRQDLPYIFWSSMLLGACFLAYTKNVNAKNIQIISILTTVFCFSLWLMIKWQLKRGPSLSAFKDRLWSKLNSEDALVKNIFAHILTEIKADTGSELNLPAGLNLNNLSWLERQLTAATTSLKLQEVIAKLCELIYNAHPRGQVLSAPSHEVVGSAKTSLQVAPAPTTTNSATAAAPRSAEVSKDVANLTQFLAKRPTFTFTTPVASVISAAAKLNQLVQAVTPEVLKSTELYSEAIPLQNYLAYLINYHNSKSTQPNIEANDLVVEIPTAHKALLTKLSQEYTAHVMLVTAQDVIFDTAIFVVLPQKEYLKINNERYKNKVDEFIQAQAIPLIPERRGNAGDNSCGLRKIHKDDLSRLVQRSGTLQGGYADIYHHKKTKGYKIVINVHAGDERLVGYQESVTNSDPSSSLRNYQVVKLYYVKDAH